MTTRCRNLIPMTSFWDPDSVRKASLALHVSLNSGVEAALMCLDSLKLFSCTRNPCIGSSISITMEGPIARGVEPGVSLEEDPGEAESDAGMVLEPEGLAPLYAEGIDIIAVGGSLSPSTVLLVCGYCIWSDTTGDMVDRACAELESRMGGSGSRHPQLNMSDSRSANHADKPVSESSQSRQPESIRENTPYLEQLLKPPQGRRWQIERLYRGRQLLAQLQPPINVLDEDHGSLEIPRDPVPSKGSEIKVDGPKPLEESIDAANQDIPRTSALRCNKYLRRSPEEQADPRQREEPQKEGVICQK
ncbi:hypothetical protein M9H77_35544 [Catharanthus roseus]|uniref:Uncharacterized protein n=1 Tax=Catharanthus roseus TaxID=4058 RepID=A0ACB9ZQ79_CATRO|nr:hypothetical protein M9H77_35544 [Catharanthus roseus]